MGKFFGVMLFVSFISFSASLNINPVCDLGDVFVDTVLVGGVEYHKIILDSYPLMITGSGCAGLPSLPYIVKTFLTSSRYRGIRPNGFA